MQKAVSNNDVFKQNLEYEDSQLPRIPIAKKTVSQTDLNQFVHFHKDLDKISNRKGDSFTKDCASDCLSSLQEVKSDYVKKKTRLVFFADRLIKIYENGYFAYFTSKRGELKALIKPKQLLMVSLDGKDKMKIITKKKTYQFKFSDSESAKSWVSELNKIILQSVVSD